MNGQELINAFITAMNGHFQYEAVIKAADKAFDAAIISAISAIIVVLISSVVNIRLSNKQKDRDVAKTYTMLYADDKFKRLDDLRKVMAQVIGLSCDLWRRSLIIAKSDGSPRADEYKNYQQIAMVDFNKTVAMIKLLLDGKKYEKFFQEIDDFRDKILSSADEILKDKDVALDAHIKIFEENCREILDEEWQTINVLSQKTYIEIAGDQKNSFFRKYRDMTRHN